jgi:hypothetical protein
MRRVTLDLEHETRLEMWRAAASEIARLDRGSGIEDCDEVQHADKLRAKISRFLKQDEGIKEFDGSC